MTLTENARAFETTRKNGVHAPSCDSLGHFCGSTQTFLVGGLIRPGKKKGKTKSTRHLAYPSKSEKQSLQGAERKETSGACVFAR